MVIPAVAALFTAASFVVGSDLRGGTTAAHGTVLETGPAGSRATTILGLVSRNGRDGEGDFPSGWTAGGVDNSFFGGQFTTASNLAVRTSGDGVDATVPLAAGGFGILRGTGPVDDRGRPRRRGPQRGRRRRAARSATTLPVRGRATLA